MFIDTHCHLDAPEFKHEVSSILGRARVSRVDKLVNVGVDCASSKASVDLARRYPEVHAAIGIHPEAANELDLTTRGYLTELSTHKRVVAVGEIGLDYYHLKRSSQYAHFPDRDEQIFCFEQMLDLALELNLPVIVHSRESDADLIAILKSYSGGLRGVVHCFSGNYEFAEKILDMGFALSFTGNITYKNNQDVVEVIKKIPLGSIMIETDAPFLTPEPFRGKRNEPAYVLEVAKKIADIKNVSLAEVERETTKKAEKFFKI